MIISWKNILKKGEVEIKCPCIPSSFLPKWFQRIGNDLKLGWVEMQASGCESLFHIMKHEQKKLLKQKITTTLRDSCPTSECQRFSKSSQQETSHWEAQPEITSQESDSETWMCSVQVFQWVPPTGFFKSFGDSLSHYSETFKIRHSMETGRTACIEWENTSFYRRIDYK